MKVLIVAISLFCTTAWAQTPPIVYGKGATPQAQPGISAQYDNAPAVFIQNEQMGSGAPFARVTEGSELARYWGDGLYYVPGYYPGFPTAATLWPRMVEVPCIKNADGSLSCHGYSVLAQQAGNRGEFILFKPVIEQPAAPVVQTQSPPVTIIVQSCCPKKEPLPLIKKKIRQ